MTTFSFSFHFHFHYQFTGKDNKDIPLEIEKRLVSPRMHRSKSSNAEAFRFTSTQMQMASSIPNGIPSR
eukprot:scaffold32494_cov94-Skeletonema_dohrnii-CCMP3373.AAC.2